MEGTILQTPSSRMKQTVDILHLTGRDHRLLLTCIYILYSRAFVLVNLSAIKNKNAVCNDQNRNIDERLKSWSQQYLILFYTTNIFYLPQILIVRLTLQWGRPTVNRFTNFRSITVILLLLYNCYIIQTPVIYRNLNNEFLFCIVELNETQRSAASNNTRCLLAFTRRQVDTWLGRSDRSIR